MLKLVKPGSKKAYNHEEVFILQYDWLLEHALRLTSQDRELAEDLVQEAFVQFTFSRPDLDSIETLRGYLYGMLRNLYLMDLRRATHHRSEPLALIDYDSVDLGLRARDLSQALQTKNELALICSYACQRKRTSKAGSVLILRYFHGYYPNEIAAVIQSSRPVVSELLQVSRSEARRYVEDPRSLTFLGNDQPVVEVDFDAGISYVHLLSQLRQAILKARVGPCLSESELDQIYRAERSAPVDADVLQHLVSCVPCLDAVNTTLDLPLLSERNPADMLSPNKPDKPGGSGGDGPGDAGGTDARLDEVRKKCRRRARRVYEHKPRELCVSVNGNRQFSQLVGAETCEQSVSLEVSDSLELIEVSSEQGVRLLFIQVSNDVELEQTSHVELSDGRTLRVSLDRSTLRPRLNVRYEDPTFNSPPSDEVQTPAVESHDDRLFDQPEVHSSRRWLDGVLAWLKTPFAITAIVVLVLVAGFLWFKRTGEVTRNRELLANELLSRSAEDEMTFLNRTDTVLHRQITFLRKVLDSNSSSVQKVEVWHSAEKGITTRRLYDEQDRLIAGLWQKRNGVQTLYQHGRNAELRLADRNTTKPFSFESLWYEEPTAVSFLRLVGKSPSLQTEELASTYLISYRPQTPQNGVVRASIVLAKPDLHVTEMTIVVNELASNQTSVVEYQFVEASFEKRSPSTVLPSVFEPDSEFRDEVGAGAKKSVTPNANLDAGLGNFEPAPVASADVEVEVLRLLHGVGADLGEQITVTRTRDGLLRVSGVVDSEQRKTEIVNALRPVANSRAAWVEVETVAEALARQQSLHPGGGTTVVAATQAADPATMVTESDLRAYFSAQGSQAEELSRQYAMKIVTRSRNAMVHIYAMKRLLGQFSSAQLETLSPDAREKWLDLLASHARAYTIEMDLLRNDLQPVFFAGQSISRAEPGTLADVAATIATANELIGVATDNDVVIRYSFTTSSEISSPNGSVKRPEFWRAMDRAVRLATRLAAASR